MPARRIVKGVIWDHFIALEKFGKCMFFMHK